MSWPAIVVLAIGAYGFKFLGVFVLARLGTATGGVDEETPGWFPAMATLIPAALFAALIAVQTFEFDGSLRLDARAAGVALSAVAVWRRAPFVLVVVVAMTVTAAIRWQTSG